MTIEDFKVIRQRAGGAEDLHSDALFILFDDADITKQSLFQLSGITTGNRLTYTLPGSTADLGFIGLPTVSGPNLEMSDPGADRILFWDDDATNPKPNWLTVGTGLDLTDTTLTVDESAVDHGGLGGLTDDDHTIYLLADGTRNLSDDLLVVSTKKINFGDTAIGIYSQADTFLDLFADGAVRIGDSSAGAPTNYSKFEADGTLEFNGDAVVFNDLQFPISNAKVPAANAPTWQTFTTNTNEYGFAVNDFIDSQANETPHGWKHDTVGHVHLHITTKSANATGSDRFAKFTVWIAFADTGETWQETSFTAELTIPDGTAALEQFNLDMGDLSLIGFVEESEIRARPKRIAATGGTEYSGEIFITQVGIHMEHDTVGSRTENVK